MYIFFLTAAIFHRIDNDWIKKKKVQTWQIRYFSWHKQSKTKYKWKMKFRRCLLLSKPLWIINFIDRISFAKIIYSWMDITVQLEWAWEMKFLSVRWAFSASPFHQYLLTVPEQANPEIRNDKRIYCSQKLRILETHWLHLCVTSKQRHTLWHCRAPLRTSRRGWKQPTWRSSSIMYTLAHLPPDFPYRMLMHNHNTLHDVNL